MGEVRWGFTIGSVYFTLPSPSHQGRGIGKVWFTPLPEGRGCKPADEWSKKTRSELPQCHSRPHVGVVTGFTGALDYDIIYMQNKIIIQLFFVSINFKTLGTIWLFGKP